MRTRHLPNKKQTFYRLSQHAQLDPTNVDIFLEIKRNINCVGYEVLAEMKREYCLLGYNGM
jgi:hypothetical protein